MRLKFYLFLKLTLVGLFTIGMVLVGFAQRSISGTITDAENGEPLIGANILVEGTSTGTVTDFDGNYTLDVPEGGTTLLISYTGYAEQTIDLNQYTANVIDLQMSAGEVLDEVVVIGYGVVKKEDATGSVIAVDEETFNKGALTSPDQLITGKVAGVQIIANSGEPGGQNSIRIRGGTSINASNEPLYVIDGVPIDNTAVNPGGQSSGRNPLNFLNPADIATMTVLKDASATAIYGARGANGVVLITTKKGKAGERTKVTYDGYVSVATVENDFGNLNADQFRNVVTGLKPASLDRLGTANTDWFDELTQTGLGHSHNLSMTGGAENLGYRVSGGYQRIEGVVRNSSTERVSIGLSMTQDLFNDKLTINTNLKGSFTDDQFDAGQIGGAYAFDPTQPVLDPTNLEYGGFFEYGTAQSPRNPVSANEQQLELGDAFRSVGSIDFNYKLDFILEGLSAKLNLGYDINKGNRRRLQPLTFATNLYNGYDGEVRNEDFTRSSALLESYLSYVRTFGKHDLNIIAGYAYQDFNNRFPSFRAFNLPSDVLEFNSAGAAQNTEIFLSELENRLISFYGRANYTIDNKYLITATVRRDGSSRFGPENRWGIFPSFALGWKILNEDFASGLSGIFSDLKLRLGYGVTGTESIGDYLYLPTIRLSTPTARYQFGDEFITTARPNAYDPNLKWEETTTFNAGIDFGFANGKVNGSLEYYFKNTDDLLFTVNIPAGTNLSDRLLTNIGELENQGVELTLNANVLNRDKLFWDVGFNAAFNANEVKRISQLSGDGILRGGISGGVGNNIQIIQVGQEVNAFYVFQHRLGDDGLPLPDDGTGDLSIYEDLNGDGTINDDDRRPFQSPAPDWILGLTSNMSYGPFDMNFTFRGNIGNYVYNNNASNNGYQDKITEAIGAVNNVHESVLSTRFIRPQYFSDYYVEDASFLRLDNLTIGYSPRINSGGISSMRVYVTGQNLLTFTNYTGVDPEVATRDDIGIDKALYPRPRTFIFGVNVGF